MNERQVVLLSLGGNVGDRRALMDAAVTRLGALPQTTLLARSRAYRSEPDGPIADQPWFVNLAVTLETALTLTQLGEACRAIEAALGRDRAAEISWGPRPMDIDIVAAGTAQTMRAPGGKFDDRAFVLMPAAEIAPDVMLGGETLAARAKAAGPTDITPLDWPSG